MLLVDFFNHQNEFLNIGGTQLVFQQQKSVELQVWQKDKLEDHHSGCRVGIKGAGVDLPDGPG